jgi:hypothetical protein
MGGFTMTVKHVRQMVFEAVTAIGDGVIKNSEIRHYIKSKYDGINEGTINCQIIVCCVNHQSRIHHSVNFKPRIAKSQYDFLYHIGKGQVTLYNPEKHGHWEIAEVGGRLVVRRTDDNADIKLYRPTRQKNKRTDIPRPSSDEVRRYLKKWDTLESYTAQESALNKLFWQVAPKNYFLDDILIKVATLNTFYSTNIKSVFTVARHIFNLNIDERLKFGDETLVDEIANVTLSSDKARNEFSFATKYCSHHNADAYPIYDSFVVRLLCYLRDVYGFSEFQKDELRKFAIFKRVILELRKFYSLETFTLKEIDQYLWQLGKEKFPKNYGKRKHDS